MKMFRAIGVSLAAVIITVWITACGGGSYGTGLRTLEPGEIETKKQPLFDPAKIFASHCKVRLGGTAVRIGVTTELGDADRFAESGAGCGFSVPKQAQAVTLILDGLSGHSLPEVRAVEHSCETDAETDAPVLRAFTTSEKAILPRLRWRAGTYYKLLISDGVHRSAELFLLDDRTEKCAAIVPPDGTRRDH